MELWWGPFIQTRKCISLKFTEEFFAGEFCVMTMKNDAKFEEELTGQLKINIRNLTKFGQSTQKSQKLMALMGFFWTKYIVFELKKVQGSYVWRQWILIQHLEENWLVRSKMTWGRFHQSTFENLKVESLMGSLKFEQELPSQFKIDMRN